MKPKRPSRGGDAFMLLDVHRDRCEDQGEQHNHGPTALAPQDIQGSGWPVEVGIEQPVLTKHLPQQLEYQVDPGGRRESGRNGFDELGFTGIRAESPGKKRNQAGAGGRGEHGQYHCLQRGRDAAADRARRFVAKLGKAGSHPPAPEEQCGEYDECTSEPCWSFPGVGYQGAAQFQPVAGAEEPGEALSEITEVLPTDGRRTSDPEYPLVDIRGIRFDSVGQLTFGVVQIDQAIEVAVRVEDQRVEIVSLGSEEPFNRRLQFRGIGLPPVAADG